MNGKDRATAAAHPLLPDARALRAIFATFATGVTVLSVASPMPRGMTANSFSSVSLDPPLVLTCIGRSATMHSSMLLAGSFGVSVLAADQQQVAQHFANAWRAPGLAQFDPVGWFPGRRTGVPLIAGALAWFECELWRSYDGGDHTIFVGHLKSAAKRGTDDGRAQDALLFYDGRYHELREPTALT